MNSDHISGHPPKNPRQFFAASAWIGQAWASNVLLEVDANGHWCAIKPNQDAVPNSAIALPGSVLPGMVNAHSHAFQRAMAGLAECRPDTANSGQDDFWSWRTRMYSAAQRITPAQLEAVATQLYTELLAGGYTQVCEFHYLHNAPSGSPYADPLALVWPLIRAAKTSGIGLTLLPTLYMRSGFAATGLQANQARFASSPERILRMTHAIAGLGEPLINAGVALHSLRAVQPNALAEVADEAKRQGWPVHLHVAEQQQEVTDSVTHSGLRPVEWLLSHTNMDARWNLVHATQTTKAELAGIAQSGASVVLCPSTEANLGDGVFDLPGYAQCAGQWSIGSDSHVTRRWSEELRLLEYSQRLMLRQRNVAAHAYASTSTAGALFVRALAGGPAACGQAIGGIATGQRADFCVLQSGAPALAGMPHAHLLDALVFSSPEPCFAQVHVAGRMVWSASGLARETSPTVQTDFENAMNALWTDNVG